MQPGSQLTGLSAALAKFAPTRIAVEMMPERQGTLDEAYRQVREGERDLEPDEIEQIGFRLAKTLAHDRLFAVDAKRRFYEPWVDPDEYAVEHGPEYPGVDAKTAWFNRNLRIFANLTRITRGPQERILIIIGSGHLAILRHCIEASPDYDLVEVADVLN